MQTTNTAQGVSIADAEGFIDPLDPDAFDDVEIVTTRRSLLRLVLVAAETASRFTREGVDLEPIAWMAAPRRLFHGRTAIDACLERESCLRAVLLHGLSMGMDAEPESIDDLVDDPFGVDDADAANAADDARSGSDDRCGRLWTSCLVDHDGEGMVQAFDAVIASNRSEAETRLSARHGRISRDKLDIVEGFDANAPLVASLVSPALAAMLEQVDADPGSPLAEGLSLSVHQRFLA